MKTNSKSDRRVKPGYDREVFNVLHMVYLSGKTDREICDKAGISIQTLRAWRLGPKFGG